MTSIYITTEGTQQLEIVILIYGHGSLGIISSYGAISRIKYKCYSNAMFIGQSSYELVVMNYQPRTMHLLCDQTHKCAIKTHLRKNCNKIMIYFMIFIG